MIMSTEQKRTDRVAIVTGASSGIGLGLVKRLVADGYRVVANARQISTAQALQPSARLRLVDGDVAAPATGPRLVAAALEFGAGLDLLVNNAGIFVPGAFEEYTPEQYQRVVDTNLAGFFYVTQPAVRRMKEQGSGHIVTLSTSLVDQPIKGINAALTSLTKGGLNAVTKQLSLELVEHGVRINAIAAGIIDTPMHKPESHAFLKGLHPMPRLGTVDDIVEAILYLDHAPFISGEILHVDGGANAGKW
jgi:NAD(P)-dependent dehydrogenase (short-subunit alcohol dehydrogenase family)